jgi:hypothetical protein
MESGSAHYETSDFYLASYLRCIGYALVGMRREGSRGIFQCEDRPERPTDIVAFFGNQTEVNPLRFVSAIKDLKALLYAA